MFSRPKTAGLLCFLSSHKSSSLALHSDLENLSIEMHSKYREDGI